MLAALLARTRVWEEQSAFLTEALAGAGGTVENDCVRISVLGGRVSALEFTDAAPGAGQARVREAVRRAYAEAAARTNHDLADATGQVLGSAGAQAVRDSVTPEVGDAAESLDLDTETPAGWPQVRVETGDFDRLDALLDSIDTDALLASHDPREYLADLGYNEVPHFDSTDWQGDLDREVAAITTDAAGLADRLGAVREEQETATCVVTVNGHGVLLDLRLRPAASSRSAEELSADFRTAYALAVQAAGEQARTVLGGDAGPLAGLFTPPVEPEDFGD